MDSRTNQEMAAFINSLKAVIKEKHLLQHTFYQMWEAGTLPIEVMQKYSEQYYHLERAFPTFLSRMHTDCDEFDVRQAITENLYDEEHGSENHTELWKRFGETIGATRKGMENSTQLPETKQAIDTFKTLSGQSFLAGVGGLAAYESQIPAVAETKLKGLQTHYGIDNEKGTEFFKLHGVLDIKHAQTWWDIISKYADTPEKQEEVLKAVEQGRDALWGFLSGIMREYLPDCECAH